MKRLIVSLLAVTAFILWAAPASAQRVRVGADIRLSHHVPVRLSFGTPYFEFGIHPRRAFRRARYWEARTRHRRAHGKLERQHARWHREVEREHDALHRDLRLGYASRYEHREWHNAVGYDHDDFHHEIDDRHKRTHKRVRRGGRHSH